MLARHDEQHVISDNWRSAGQREEVRTTGWPLGLQQSLMRRAFAEAPLFIVSTPSITSDSSSDLDTESTGSFFPEKSQTLGSLIGIRSSAAHEPQNVPEEVQSITSQLSQPGRRRSTSTSVFGRSRSSWCPMMGCGCGAQAEAQGMSPSLAHLLQEERKGDPSQGQKTRRDDIRARAECDSMRFDMPSSLLNNNTLFDDRGILPPPSSGAPLKLILQHASTTSAYLSADWNVFHSHDSHRISRGPGRGGGRFTTTFWPTLCGRHGQWIVR
ncbi:hypothetical protein KP509_29G025700 [Ceratopteris richardii]|uniref:Uncharacterized protein n=1 Tax=Ceratopteris richardii TaxID=49495 RepID=A0A8T2R7E7_CERRI|nr:hypothetical protein KP509_29G025700 [Ceratopteris richardii]